MTGAVLGLAASLADALAPTPIRIAAAKGDSHNGAYLAVALAFAAAAAALAVHARRGKRG